MESEMRHTNSNQYHCHHNNTGYCKFGHECRFPHYYELCQKQVCREKMCRSRHPKSCKFGINCKFFKRQVCVYKHFDKKIDASENLAKEIKDLEMDVEKLEGEIEILKRCIESKEIQLNKKTVEKEESETGLLAKIRDQSEVIVKLKKENLGVKTNFKDMDDKIKELGEKIDSQEVVIQKFKSMLKCDKCDFQAENLTEFNVHLSVKHTVKATKGQLKCTKCDFKAKKQLDLELHEPKKSDNSENGEGNKAGCDECDFSSTDQFSLLLHKSTKHPTYILNSQPEAVTGPLH